MMYKKLLAFLFVLGVVIAVIISFFVQQKNTYAWSSNDSWLDIDFWENHWMGNDAMIVNALYGDGIGQLDKTRYSRYWNQHVCDPVAMNVVHIPLGTDTLPATLAGNTIYVLEAGMHMQNYTVTIDSDCTALIAQRTTVNTTGGQLRFNGSLATGVSIQNVRNVIVGDGIFWRPNVFNTIGNGIDADNIQSSIIIGVETRGYISHGIFLKNANNVQIFGNIYSNQNIGIRIGSSTGIMIGDWTGSVIAQSFSNMTGVLIETSSYIDVFAEVRAGNQEVGLSIKDSNNINIRGRNYNNNTKHAIMMENVYNVFFYGSDIVPVTIASNGGYGLYINSGSNIVSMPGSRVISRNNTSGSGFGIYFNNVNNVSLSNLRITQNTKDGVYLSGGQNISINNTTITGNLENGLVTYNVLSGFFTSITGSINGNDGIAIQQSQNINISSVTANNNGDGISVGDGLSVADSQSVTINNAVANMNFSDGIFIDSNTFNTQIANIATSSNGANGLEFMNATNFIVTNYIASGNDESGVHLGGSFSGFLSSGLVYENQVGVSIGQGSTGNVVDRTTGYRNLVGLGIVGADTQYNTIQYSNAYENSNAGFYLGSTLNNALTHIHAYDNALYGIIVHNASYNNISHATTNTNAIGIEMNSESWHNALYGITSFSNVAQGLYLFESNFNNMQYLWLYDNSVGLHIDEGKENVLNNMLSYDNENAGIAITGKGSNRNAINNFALFNNIYGLVMYDMGGADEIRRNVFNNGALFNNVYAIYMQDSFAPNSTADNIFNDLNMYNNDRGVYATGVGIIADNLYYGNFNMVSNTVDFFGTNGFDAILDAGTVVPSGLGWYPGGLNTFAGFVMTCNQAIQATNTIGANLLQYPYCNARGPHAWTGLANVRYTFFPDIIKQQQPVAYTGVLPSMTLIASGVYDANMYVGDLTWTGVSPFGGHIELDESMSYTYQSGGFTYRNTVGPLAIDMISSQSPTTYIVTGVNDSTWNGILMQIGRNPWVASYAPFYFDLAPGGLSIIRVAYKSAGQESNYYGMIRGVEDDDISIHKQANIQSAMPGQQVGFAITVTNSGIAPAGFGQLVDFLPEGISPIGIAASPVGVYSGSIHAYIWDIPVLSGETSYTFYITGTIISGYTGLTLINTGYYISDYTSNGADWMIYDEAVVTVMISGVCGTLAQTGYGNVVLLTSGSIGLCEQGVVTSFTGPNQFNQYSWSCDGYNGGSNALCVAEYGWCGDGGLQSMYEQCDDGNNANGDGCSDRCNWETPTCTITANPVYALGSPTTFTFTFPAWAQAYNLNFGNAIAVSGTGNLSGMSYTYTYPAIGLYTGTLSVRNAASTGRTNTCTVQLSVVNAPVDGVCNSSVTSQTYYTGTMPTGSLCTSGDPTTPVLSSGLRTWSCNGQHGGSSDFCDADVSYCGDGVVGTGVGYLGQEQCDDGNNGNYDGCNAVCQWEQPSCTIQATPSSGVVPLGVVFSITQNTGSTLQYIEYGTSQTGTSMNHAYTQTGSYIATAYVSNPQNSGLVASCSAGINISDVPIDGVCNSSVTSQTYYTGTMPTGSLCTSGDPTTPVLSSGLRTWSCNGQHGGSSDFCDADVSYCGDGVVGTGVGYLGQEQCDDGVNNGLLCVPGYGQSCSYCSNACQEIVVEGPYCGDGIVDYDDQEQCDDGNSDEYDGCNSQCMTNQCETVLLYTIDPFMVYQGGYPVYDNATGYIFAFTTPTIGPNYSYQWSVSGLDMSNIDAVGISGYVDDTIVYVFVETQNIPADFQVLVELIVADGVTTGSVGAVVGCAGNACTFFMPDYQVQSVQGSAVIGNVGTVLAQQNINMYSTNPGSILISNVSTMSPGSQPSFNIYTCDIQEWVVAMYDAGLLQDEFGLTVEDFLELYEEELASVANEICTDSPYPWQGVSSSESPVAYTILYENGSQLGLHSGPIFGGYSGTIDINNYSDTFVFNMGSITNEDWADYLYNNIGMYYYNTCLVSCGDGIVSPNEQCDEGADNGLVCVPGYGQSCTYCSNICENTAVDGSFCGDGVIDYDEGEQCDLGSLNGQSNSGCSQSCQLEQLSCSILGVNTVGNPPLTAAFAVTMWTSGSYFDYGNGMTGTSVVHTYTTPGSFVVTGYIPHPASGSIILTCSYPVLVNDPVVPVCDLPFVYSYTGGGSAYSSSQIPFALQITNTGSQYTGDYSIVTYIYSGDHAISLSATGWLDVNRTYGSGIYTGIVLQQTGLGSGVVAYHIGYANATHTGSYIAVTQVRQSKNNQEYLCSMHTYTGSVSIAPYCGDGIVNQSSEECDGGTNCTTQCTIRRSSGGGGGISTDYCPNGDFSGSYYDGKCGEPVMHGAAPIGRACRYEDEQYLIRGTFTDSIRHRGRPYTEIMRLACLWRGRQTKIGLWNVEPDGWMQRDEALKTFVKILGVAFENFDIQSEELLYTSAIPFADVAYDNWFSHYTNYAFTAGLTDTLVTTRDGKRYLDPTKNINRYEFAKLVVLAYEKIHGVIVVSETSTLQDVPMTHPYADYVRKLEMIGLVEGYKQSDGSRVFRGDQLISRAEVAKLVSMGFNEQLIVTEQAVVASSAYQMIARAIQQTKTDRLTFIRNLFEQLKKIDDKVFLDRFQVSKDIFLKTLADKVLMPMLQ